VTVWLCRSYRSLLERDEQSMAAVQDYQHAITEPDVSSPTDKACQVIMVLDNNTSIVCIAY
jgi:hypothetical protein